jgi:Na+/melibiose symporter-like transporter
MAKLDPSNIRDRIFGAEENSAAGLDQEKLKQQQTLAARIFHTPVLSVRETLFPAFSAMGRQLAEMVDKNYRQIYLFSILRFNMTYMVLIDALIGVYDVLNNPLMGIAYDKTRTRWGKSRPYVFLAPVFYFATIAMVFCAKLFFNNDDPNDMRKVL